MTKTTSEAMENLRQECFNLWNVLGAEAKEFLTYLASGWKAWCLTLIMLGSVVLAAYGLRALVGG